MLQYQRCDNTVETADIARSCDNAIRFSEANINTTTGLATDYLNHFNEAIMLLEMVATFPESLDDISKWRPMSYRDHFLSSNLKARNLIIEAYENADPVARENLENLSRTMTVVIQATRKTITGELSPLASEQLIERAVTWLKLLVAQASAVIHDDSNDAKVGKQQATVDSILHRA